MRWLRGMVQIITILVNRTTTAKLAIPIAAKMRQKPHLSLTHRQSSKSQ